MKRAIIIHGYQGHPEGGWKPWLKKELELRGFGVSIPAMPHPDEPVLKEWVATIEREVGQAGSDCILVGHSLGCIAILRYLEGKGAKAKGAVLVAGFAQKLGDGFSILDGFVGKPVDWKSVKGACGKFTALFSDNDPHIPLSQEKLFREKLGAKTLVLHARGHFSSSEGTDELPEALSAVLEISA